MVEFNDHEFHWKYQKNWAECKSCGSRWYWSNMAKEPGSCDDCGSKDIDYAKTILEKIGEFFK